MLLHPKWPRSVAQATLAIPKAPESAGLSSARVGHRVHRRVEIPGQPPLSCAAETMRSSLPSRRTYCGCRIRERERRWRRSQLRRSERGSSGGQKRTVGTPLIHTPPSPSGPSLPVVFSAPETPGDRRRRPEPAPGPLRADRWSCPAGAAGARGALVLPSAPGVAAPFGLASCKAVGLRSRHAWRAYACPRREDPWTPAASPVPRISNAATAGRALVLAAPSP